MNDSNVNLEIETKALESQSKSTDSPKPAKKKFVAPEISTAVDVLEATTFFQAATSGSAL